MGRIAVTGKTSCIRISVGLALVVLSITACAVGGCTREERELDDSFVTDAPCAAPCWHNITPGVSSNDDVRAQLQDSPFVQEGTLSYSAVLQRDVWLRRFLWQDRRGSYDSVYLREDVVLAYRATSQPPIEARRSCSQTRPTGERLRGGRW
jgi:hypothetical protein